MIRDRLTLEQVKQINSKRQAVEDYIYTDVNGIRYIGTSGGYLDKVHTIKGEVTGDLEDAEIDHINDYTRAEIIAALGQVTTNQNSITTINTTLLTKADTCFAIGMAVAL